MMGGDVILRGGTPTSEYDVGFLQGMIDRMLTSHGKYGYIKDSMDKGLDALSEARNRVSLYRQTGNTEYLIDAANFIMAEFMHPQHDNAHFEALGSSESPGRAMRDGTRHDKHADQMGGDL